MKKLIIILAILVISSGSWGDTLPGRNPRTIDGASGGTITGDVNVTGDIACTNLSCSGELLINDAGTEGTGDIVQDDVSGNKLFHSDASEKTVTIGSPCVFLNGEDGSAFCTEIATLTSAEINALNTTAQLITPYIALTYQLTSSQFIEMASVVVVYNYTSTEFTVDAIDDIVFQYQGSTLDVTEELELTGFIDQTNDEIRLLKFVTPNGEEQNYTNRVQSGLQVNGTASHDGTTGGNDNSMTFISTYYIHDTGL